MMPFNILLVEIQGMVHSKIFPQDRCLAQHLVSSHPMECLRLRHPSRRATTPSFFNFLLVQTLRGSHDGSDIWILVPPVETSCSSSYYRHLGSKLVLCISFFLNDTYFHLCDVLSIRNKQLNKHIGLSTNQFLAFLQLILKQCKGYNSISVWNKDDETKV